MLAAAIVLPPGLNLAQYWWHNPLYGYGLWVPVLALALVWRRGLGTSAAALGWMTAAVIGTYFALLPGLRVVQIANPDWRMLDWLLAGGAVLALCALALRVGGRVLLARCWFPLFFLLTAVPWSTSAERGFTERAVPATATAASEVLWSLGIATVDDGRTLRTAVGPIGVNEDCSGIRGVQLAVMASLFWCGWLRLKNGRAVAMLVGGVALALLLNVLRVAVIVGAAVRTGRLEMAERLHDPGGTAAQFSLMLGLPALAWALRKKDAPPRSDGPGVAGWRWVAPRTAVAALVWISASEAAAQLWFRSHERPASGGAPHWAVRRPAPIAGATEQPIPTPIRENYRYSDGVSLAWHDAQDSRWTLFWLDFDAGALSACTHNVHRPEVCLPSHDYVRGRQFPDLEVKFGDAALVLHHDFYQRGAQPLHLFYATVQETAAAVGQGQTDWTLLGRLRAARLGLRTQRSEMIHVLIEAAYPPREARRAVEEYLRALLVPEPPIIKG